MRLVARSIRAALTAALAAVALGALPAAAGAQADSGGMPASETGGVPPVGAPGLVEGMPNVPYAPLIAAAADRYGLDRLLLTALVRQESNFNPTVTSRAGARGLTQLMPGTARMLGLRVGRRRHDQRVIPEIALDAGARYLRMQLDRFRDVRLALAAYNAGPGAVRRYRGIPPYRETRNYVRRVLQHRAEYLREVLLAGRGP